MIDTIVVYRYRQSWKSGEHYDKSGEHYTIILMIQICKHANTRSQKQIIVVRFLYFIYSRYISTGRTIIFLMTT